MSNPIAYHITWHTHGTWLPGDEVGWVKRGIPGIRPGDSELEDKSRRLLNSPPVTLDDGERQIVEATFRDHCKIRNWTLHAINVRTNHVHIVVTADVKPEVVLAQLKAWCSRRLNAIRENPPKKWWVAHGSTKWINDEDYFEKAVNYVKDGQ